MKGFNTLMLNQATIAQAVEDYLNAQRIQKNILVKSVSQPNNEEFKVVTEVKIAGSHG